MILLVTVTLAIVYIERTGPTRFHGRLARPWRRLTVLETVREFVEKCGGAARACSALEAYEAVVAAVK